MMQNSSDFANYAKVIADDSTFVHAFWYTAAFTVVSVILINVLAFAVALLTDQRHQRNQHFPYRIFHAEPDRRYRAWLHLAAALKRHPDEIQPYPDIFLDIWLSGDWSSLMCWQQIGYMMIIYIAGIQNIPGELIEAAEIDGATKVAGPEESHHSHGNAVYHRLHLPDTDQLLQALSTRTWR